AQERSGDGGLDPETAEQFHRMLEQMARRKQDYLDQLPQDLGGQIGQLQDYDFMDPGAREQFQELLAMLQQQVMQSYFQGMQQSIQQMSPEDLARIREMVRDLNQMLEQRMLGQEPNFQEFMDKHGEFFPGVESLDELLERMHVMGRMQGLDELEQQLRQAQFGNLENIDPEMVRQLMGNESAEDVQRLQQLTKLLEDAGYVEKRGRKYELTPRGMRKIGQKALNDIFSHLKKDRAGNHATDLRGATGDRIDDTKEYEFGDPFLLDLKGTLMNSVRREGAGSPLHLEPADFEVYRTELLTQTSTVLMVDMSRSMLLRNCFFAAKKV